MVCVGDVPPVVGPPEEGPGVGGGRPAAQDGHAPLHCSAVAWLLSEVTRDPCV